MPCFTWFWWSIGPVEVLICMYGNKVCMFPNTEVHSWSYKAKMESVCLSLGVEGGSLWLVTSSSLIVVILPTWGRGLRLFLNSSESFLTCVCTIFACREEGIVEIMQYLWIRRVVSFNKISLLLSTHFLSSFFSIWAFNANDSGIIFTALPRSSGALLSLLYRWRTEVQTEIKRLDNTRS